MFGSSWPHHLIISGAVTGGSQTADGAWSPGSAGAAIYDDKCDAQDHKGGYKVITSDTNIEDISAQLKIYLVDGWEEAIDQMEVGMQGILKRGSREDRIKIAEIDRMSGYLLAITV